MARSSSIAALLGALSLCLADLAQAQSTGAPEAKAAAAPAKDWTGYAGAGALAFPKYVGGKGTTVWPVPLLSFEYKGTVYVDLLRAGVRLWSSNDQKFAIGLAAEPRFGFKSSDGARLAGMGERHLSVEAGPSLEWETPLVSLNLAYFTGHHRQQQRRLPAWHGSTSRSSIPPSGTSAPISASSASIPKWRTTISA